MVLPTTRNPEIPGYADISAEARRLSCPVHVLRAANNSLGSYGMYLHAFAAHSEQNDFYVMSEVDYVPTRPRWDAALVRLHEQAFGGGGAPGALVAVLQGRPVEAKTSLHLHAEGTQIMTARALRQLFRYVYDEKQWGWTAACRCARCSSFPCSRPFCRLRTSLLPA